MTLLEPSPQRTPRHDGITPQRQEEFLEMLAATGCVTEAAAAIGISRTALYKYRKRPEAAEFSQAWSAALSEATAVLADDAFERAAKGSVEPVWYKGEQIGERVRHNDRLLMFLLRAHAPETYARTPVPARPVPAYRANRDSPDGASTSSTSHEDDEESFDPFALESRRAAMRAFRGQPDISHPLSKRATRRLAAKGRLAEPGMSDDG